MYQFNSRRGRSTTEAPSTQFLGYRLRNVITFASEFLMNNEEMIQRYNIIIIVKNIYIVLLFETTQIAVLSKLLDMYLMYAHYCIYQVLKLNYAIVCYPLQER